MGFRAKLVGTALSWLKAVANDILRLFNLAGTGAQPLIWFSENWLGILIVLLIIGVCADFAVWILRWRPHWAWFHLKRIVVNDASLVAESEDREERLMDGEPVRHTEYVVPKDEVSNRTKRVRHSRASSARTEDLDDYEGMFEVGGGDEPETPDERVFEVREPKKK